MFQAFSVDEGVSVNQGTVVYVVLKVNLSEETSGSRCPWPTWRVDVDLEGRRRTIRVYNLECDPLGQGRHDIKAHGSVKVRTMAMVLGCIIHQILTQ